MPYLNVRGVALYHELYGTQGPWLALTAGGRHRYLEMAPLAQAIAAQGFRVLVHDRRNTGASDFFIGGEDTEEEIWADDLVALLQMLGAPRAFFGGSSAGSRLALTVYRRHPAFVQGLLLMRVTGGTFAAGRLPRTYYGQFIEAARSGGMAAVCATAPYAERLALNPTNRARLMAMDPAQYIAVMQRWLDAFVAGPIEPVMGVPEAELQACRAPTLVVPGNDKTHDSRSGLATARLILGAELFELPITDQDVDLIPFPDWKEHFPALTARFVEFMRRHTP